MNKFTCYIMLILLPAFFSSCFTHRKAVREMAGTNDTAARQTQGIPDTTRMTTAVAATPSKQDTATPAAAAPVAPPALNPLTGQLKPLWENRLSYKTFSGKARVRYEGPDNKLEFSANFRVLKDSAIWINVVAIVSVARILITRDSLYIINYVQEEVIIKPLSEVQKILPAKLDFSSLQNLLVGEPLRQGDITGADSAGGLWTLFVGDTAYLQQLFYNKNDSSLHNFRMVTRKPNGPEASEAFANYELTNKGRLSTTREINIRNGTDNISIYMKITKADFDEPVDFPFNIPRNYKLN
jgi:hypothetical protein